MWTEVNCCELGSVARTSNAPGMPSHTISELKQMSEPSQTESSVSKARIQIHGRTFFEEAEGYSQRRANSLRHVARFRCSHVCLALAVASPSTRSPSALNQTKFGFVIELISDTTDGRFECAPTEYPPQDRQDCERTVSHQETFRCQGEMSPCQPNRPHNRCRL